MAVNVLIWTRVLILNGYQDGAVCFSVPSVRLLFVGLDEGRSSHKKGGYTRRIAHSHFGCCCPHTETWRSAQTINTRSSHASCKAHWGLGWDFRKFIVNSNKTFTPLYRFFSYNQKRISGRGEVCTRFWLGNLRERDHWGNPDVDGRIILEWIFRKWEGVMGLDGVGSG